MQLLTNSRRACFQRCRREHLYAYEMKVKPRTRGHALSFGSLFHAGLEAWWGTWMEMHQADVHREHPRDPDFAREHARERGHEAITEAFQQAFDANELDWYDYAAATTLLRGYHYRWAGEMFNLTVLAVEKPFVTELVNPMTSKASRTFRLGGILDAVIRGPDGDVWIVEHKTSSADLAPGSDYWLRLRIDGQVSGYYEGARSLGYDVHGCIYDVVRKPTIKPLKATPEEKRKYRKDGELYANQRTEDETWEEYAARINDDIAKDPQKFYQRANVVRLDEDIREYQADAWMTARAMRDAQLQQAHPRNPDACVRYGSFCPYFDVCTGVASIDDDTRFTQAEQAHTEFGDHEEGQENDDDF